MTILYNRPSNQARNSPLPYHPVADIFEPLKGEEFDALVKDIKANGLNEPITVHEGQILDGRNRERACVVAGVKPHYRTYQGDDPAGFVVSANIHRRHLTGKQKRELIAKLLKTKPEKPDLQIAKEIGASSHTVGKVRSKMEASGDVCKVQTRTDTKGRKQPAKKKTGDVRPIGPSAEKEVTFQVARPNEGSGNGAASLTGAVSRARSTVHSILIEFPSEKRAHLLRLIESGLHDLWNDLGLSVPAESPSRSLARSAGSDD
jgi:hypothetical protein